jgi:hypothetical protein
MVQKVGSPHAYFVVVAIFGQSQVTYVEACESQKTEEWLRLNEHGFRCFGGMTKPWRHEPISNRMYEDFGRHHSTGILPHGSENRGTSPSSMAQSELPINGLKRMGNPKNPENESSHP